MHVKEEEGSCMPMYSIQTKKMTFDNLYQQDGIEVADARHPALGFFFLFFLYQQDTVLKLPAQDFLLLAPLPSGACAEIRAGISSKTGAVIERIRLHGAAHRPMAQILKSVLLLKSILLLTTFPLTPSSMMPWHRF